MCKTGIRCCCSYLGCWCPAEPFCLAIYPSAFHSVMFNPVEPRLIATANSKEGVGLWDIRKPRRSDLHVLLLYACVVCFGLSAIFQMFPSAERFSACLSGCWCCSRPAGGASV